MNANAEDPRLLSVAESISDGTPVDWDKLQEHLTDPEHSVIIGELRLLESVARVTQETPSIWGPFTISNEIGRGAFGAVYRAVDPNLQLEVALKVIRSGLADAPINPERALKEARLLAKIRHPNVVRVYRAERIGNEVGLSMELIKGHTLEELVRRQAPYSANEAMLIGLDLCRALAAVHGAEMLHGDIKARNVMREEGGRTVLMDFGAGKDLKPDTRRADYDFAGTPLYLAPEVFEGRPRTKASDIYSLGVLLYYLVTGSHPVEGTTRTEIARRHGQGEPRKRLRDVRPDLPDGFIRVVDRAMAENPRDRYESAGALEAALHQALSPTPGPVLLHPPNNWKRPLVAAMLLLVVVLGTTIAYRVLHSRTVGGGDQSAGRAVTAQSALAGASADAQVTPGTADSYRIDAALYREQDGTEVRLQPGAHLAPGDRLSIQLQVSVPAYVYVINEDEQGESYLLFPLPGQTPTNPVPAGQRHRLPGIQNGERIHWQVTSAGGREHFLIFVSPQQSPAFDQMFAALPRPSADKPVLSARLSREAASALRGVGGLASTPGQSDQQLRFTPEFAIPLAASEETARGVWIRQITLENPAGPAR
jgi:eukaryotic-like serine/threonine-protein kinase